MIGVSVEAGLVQAEETPLCVQHGVYRPEFGGHYQTVGIAKQGQEVCIKILPIPRETPKFMDATSTRPTCWYLSAVRAGTVSKIPRQSIDAVKDHFERKILNNDGTYPFYNFPFVRRRIVRYGNVDVSYRRSRRAAAPPQSLSPKNVYCGKCGYPRHGHKKSDTLYRYDGSRQRTRNSD